MIFLHIDMITQNVFNIFECFSYILFYSVSFNLLLITSSSIIEIFHENTINCFFCFNEKIGSTHNSEHYSIRFFLFSQKNHVDSAGAYF